MLILKETQCLVYCCIFLDSAHDELLQLSIVSHNIDLSLLLFYVVNDFLSIFHSSMSRIV